jgi:hypothetical protein
MSVNLLESPWNIESLTVGGSGAARRQARQRRRLKQWLDKL